MANHNISASGAAAHPSTLTRRAGLGRPGLERPQAQASLSPNHLQSRPASSGLAATHYSKADPADMLWFATACPPLVGWPHITIRNMATAHYRRADPADML